MDLADYLAQQVCVDVCEKLKGTSLDHIFKYDPKKPGMVGFSNGVDMRFFLNSWILSIILDNCDRKFIFDKLGALPDVRERENGLWQMTSYPVMNDSFGLIRSITSYNKDVLYNMRLKEKGRLSEEDERIKAFSEGCASFEVLLKEREELSEEKYNTSVYRALSSSIIIPIFGAVFGMPPIKKEKVT